MSLNVSVIMGRLTADPELRTTQSGISVTRFTVAVDRTYKSGEERQADFIDCVAWREKADFITTYFKKGQMIAIKGTLQTKNYEDKNGNKRKEYELVVDEVSFCGSKGEGTTAQAQESEQPSSMEEIAGDYTDGGVPF